MYDELLVDNFAGGGGASLGIERAMGRAVDIAINHDAHAVEMHSANHPHTLHLCESVWQVDPQQATAGRPVGLAWFSPDCTHFSRAKGSKPKSKKIRGLAWIVVRWARRVRPRVIILENVREFEEWGPLLEDGRPCALRKGHTFKRFIGCLKAAGYQVEWKSLNAADYGAPTHRRRLFLIARRDGSPIQWPAATHGPKAAEPWRCAAEVIDWSLPCHSIFLTPEEARAVRVKRPLAEKTMQRIARGIYRYVIDNPRPYIVGGLVVPSIQQYFGGMTGKPVTDPLPTITETDHHALLAATLVQSGYGEREGQGPRAIDIEKPLGTVVAGGVKHALVSAHLVGAGGAEYAAKPKPVDAPASSVMPQDRRALCAAFLARICQTGSKGPCVKGVEQPLTTIVSKAEHCLITSHLAHFNHGGSQHSGMDDPMRTVTAGGLHAAEVRAFLVKYYGQGVGQQASEPLHTVTAQDRFGLVQVDGVDHQIVDIGLRMLTPRELARAQGFPDEYRLIGTARQQVARIGNSVCPQVAEALVRANVTDSQQHAHPAGSRRRSHEADVAGGVR
jgi:DNA (cytosine-5)-methyltransferase 1